MNISRSISISLLVCIFASSLAQAEQAPTGYTLPEGKEIYIPKELRDNDFTSKESTWSYYRMACTPNVVCFWEKGFGDDLSKAPDLDGHPMTVDLDNLLSRVEYFYNVYRDMMGFLHPGSKADKYRMMVMLKYSLEGTAYGGCYDNVIGALWIAPNRVQDKTLNCIAHELGHSFQIQISCDGQSQGMGGGIFETSAQWMLWQVNPRWTTDENYHWDAFKKDIHLRLFHHKNMYHAPFVLEYWGVLHGLTYMADMFRGGRQGEDFVQTYMRMYKVDVEKMGDELLNCYSRLITFDFPGKHKESARYSCELKSELADTLNGWKKPIKVPETYGFNVDEIPVPQVGKTIKIRFQGLSKEENIGYRYRLVAIDQEGKPTYRNTNSQQKKTLYYTNPGNIKKLYLVVVGCPTKEYAAGKPATYPYIIKF
ncbi:MAG: hypothetical protein J6Y59_02895 [Bacteroidaceae bacterium]|nr:hypothetical protein [Bacteroidaceae bacterium]